MLPRFALGNWWSRYYKYSEESYMELMDKFDEKNIPFTVAVIDTYSLRQSPVILV